MPVTGIGPTCCRCRRRPVSEHGHCIPCLRLLRATGQTPASVDIDWLDALFELPAARHPRQENFPNEH